MIVEDEYDLHHEINSEMSGFEDDDFDGNVVRSTEFDFVVTVPPDDPSPFASVLTKIGEVNKKNQHRQLRDDLKHHLFENFPLYKKSIQR